LVKRLLGFSLGRTIREKKEYSVLAQRLLSKALFSFSALCFFVAGFSTFCPKEVV